MKPFALARWRFTNCCGHSWGHPTTPHTPEGTPDGGSRRDFLKTAAAGVAGLAAFGSLPAKTAAQVRVFPPPPPAVSPIEGLIDFHNHCAPDVFGRAVDDDEMAQLYMARKMEAVVLKNHVALTADRAWLVRKHNPGIKAFGGITLHGAACDRVVVTHAEFDVVNVRVEQTKRAAAMGAKLEAGAMGPLMGPQAHLAWMHHWRQVTYKESAGHLTAVGGENFILGTGLGQTG